MKLPELDSPESYGGLYVFDFGDHVAVGYTADEIAVLVESERFAGGKIYRIHRALPDGTMELQGVPRQRFQCEAGLFFLRADEHRARADFDELARLAAADGPPCRMKAHLARLAGPQARLVTAIIYPAEYDPEVSAWLIRLDYRGGDTVEGGVSRVTDYYAAAPQVIDRRQWWPARSASRTADEVLATTHLALQRRPA